MSIIMIVVKVFIGVKNFFGILLVIWFSMSCLVDFSVIVNIVIRVMFIIMLIVMWDECFGQCRVFFVVRWVVVFELNILLIRCRIGGMNSIDLSVRFVNESMLLKKVMIMLSGVRSLISMLFMSSVVLVMRSIQVVMCLFGLFDILLWVCLIELFSVCSGVMERICWELVQVVVQVVSVMLMVGSMMKGCVREKFVGVLFISCVFICMLMVVSRSLMISLMVVFSRFIMSFWCLICVCCE